ncbi:MAG: flagellar biosynthetic protein FliR [Pseudomonadota bacterium]
MISFSDAQLNAWIAAFMWPFFRVLGLVASEPVLGNRSVPVSVKIGVALLITFLLTPLLAPFPRVEPASAMGLLIAAQQVLIGVAMGFTMRIIFIAVEMAGHLAGLQMGLGFAVLFDPQNSAQTAIVAQFAGLVVILLFLALNGHYWVLSTLADSFRALPISAEPLAAAGWLTLVQWGGQIFSAGVLLSLPVVAALLITNIGIGIMSRAAPQLNIFAVGFPLTLAVGFFALYFSMPYFLPALERLFQGGMEAILHILRGFVYPA